MPREVEFAIKRYEVFLRDVIAPAVYAAAQPLDVAAWQWTDIRATPPTVAHAANQAFTPVKVGWQWGPKWSTCWFRVRGVAQKSGKPLHLRFSTATEATVYEKQGDEYVLLQGLDTNRDALLNRPLKPGEHVEFLIEAACNHPFGVTGFEWDDREVHARWKSETPGRLDRAEIACFQTAVDAFAARYSFALGMLKEVHGETSLSAQAKMWHDALRAATNATSDRDVAGTSAQACASLDEVISCGAHPNAATCIAVGHAHIDTAWLWPLRETRRKCLRTFSNVAGLMDRNPDFRFMCSQAQQYEFVRQDAPALFATIGEWVKLGRWEPIGGMWVEPDANCPSGESLIRQILLGTRYWKQHFGERGRQRLLYLPDTFGFPASLPGIMKHGGLDTFITNKLHWNSSNEFPHSTFMWEGIDGTGVVGHNTPGKDYNSTMSPKEVRRGTQTFDRLHPSDDAGDRGVPSMWMQPFGFGDGGGGPTQGMLDHTACAANVPGLAKTRLGSIAEFLDSLHAARVRGQQWPLIKGELYLELHRGTLTSQAWIKKANRDAELALQTADFMAFFAPKRLSSQHSAEVMAQLDEAWKLLLLNQFHDILPGSSIGWVYEDARQDFARIDRIVRRVIEQATSLWTQSVSASGGACIVNPFDTVRSELTVDRSGAMSAGPFSISAIRATHVPKQFPCAGNEKRLSNGLMTVELDEGGRIVAIIPDPQAFPGTFARRVLMNQLVMYEDRPHMWDAWDIDATYLDKPEAISDIRCSVHVVEKSPQRIAVECVREFGTGSRIVQQISLESGSPLIHVRSKVDWREDHRLLRVLHACETTAKHAVCGIQCGAVKRPLVPHTPQDAAKFEFCAHGYVAAGDAEGGFAILCPDKYGWSARREGGQAVIGTSLLRAPTHPDPLADRGEHEFAYAILPLLAAPNPAALAHEADRFGSMPLMVNCAKSVGDAGGIDLDHGSWSPFEILPEGSAAIRIMATKRAEDAASDVVIRLHEAAGSGGTFTIRWNLPVETAWPVNGLEEAIEPEGSAFKWDAQSQTVAARVGPFGIVAIRATLAKEGRSRLPRPGDANTK